MSNEIITQPQNASQLPQTQEISAFSSIQNFEAAQRMAQALASSALVPTMYQGKTANCLVALEVAARVGASPLMVMQNLHVIHGKPSWSSTYVIAAVNTCGRFEPLRFDLSGDPGKDDRTCTAWTTPRGVKLAPEVSTLAKAKAAGVEVLQGPPVSIAMAKAEGWYGKNGSKWPTMSELMLQYRAGTFFGRIHASDFLLGMRSDDEERDIIDVTPSAPGAAVADVNEKIRSRKAKKAEQPIVDVPAAEVPISEPAADEVSL